MNNHSDPIVHVFRKFRVVKFSQTSICFWCIKSIWKSNFCKSSIVHSHLNSIIDDNDYKLVGWQRECTIIDNPEPEFNDKK